MNGCSYKGDASHQQHVMNGCSHIRAVFVNHEGEDSGLWNGKKKISFVMSVFGRE
jgi:hypothetical protein